MVTWSLGPHPAARLSDCDSISPVVPPTPKLRLPDILINRETRKAIYLKFQFEEHNLVSTGNNFRRKKIVIRVCPMQMVKGKQKATCTQLPSFSLDFFCLSLLQKERGDWLGFLRALRVRR